MLDMLRVARIVVPEALHHITQRGNNRQDVFFVDDDRRHYLKLLKEQAERYGLKLVGYCLMTNHVHILAEPAKADSLAKAMGRGLNRFHSLKRCRSVEQRRLGLHRRGGQFYGNCRGRIVGGDGCH